MLLQRASAGSGKTFKLAKTYIRLFISVRDEDYGFYRLLSPDEVRDAHSHILGITFTNKATNEMKQRIVEELAVLSRDVPEKGKEPANYKFPHYLLDFTGESKNADPLDDVIYISKGQPASRREITETCRAALKALLNDYGNFNISTIDSFFQSVLRTLAYELKLNDTYHVELNDDYLAQVGVDETIGSVKETGQKDERQHLMSQYMSDWLRSVMSRRLRMGEAWDAFSKRSSKGIYGELLAMAGKMSREDFKKHMDGMSDYFATPDRFLNFYNGVLRASAEVESLHKEAIEAVSQLRSATQRDDYNSGIESGLIAIVEASSFSTPKTGVKFDVNRSSYDGDPDSRNHPFKKESSHRNNPRSISLFTKVCDTLKAWQDSRAYWATVLSRLHYMGPLNFINQSIDIFREENNVIPLSATNDILRRIIGEDEMPFIYERTGVRLHHFLLDEFQDTSQMQWSNLRPLLAQSDASNYENLIIGDAKQSIYRFRNAAPELISGIVEQDFPYTRVLPDTANKGTAAYNAVNSNWRSSRHVVAFNNSLFSALAEFIDRQWGGNYFSELYNNVVQTIRKTDMPGFVKLDFSSKEGFSTTPALIDDLRERGYKLSDIAILVNLSDDGKKAIDAIIKHNREKTEADPKYKPIDFISEESLSIAESTAVKVILSVMTIICRDFVSPTSDNNTVKSQKLRRGELERLVANLNISGSAQGMQSVADVAAAEEIITAADIQALYRRLSAVTLPALVEAIAAQFLSETLQSTQAAYIAAFQDAVLQYCDTYPADMNAFLDWWSENGDRLSIAAPEGIDAVQIMTIHKSKGLEFKAVIIPKADWPLGPYKENREIIWVEHVPRGLTESEAADTPSKIPVTPNANFMDNPDSPFFKAYRKFSLECRTDQLNKTYVAFTRAIRELYITAPISKDEASGKNPPKKIGGFLWHSLNNVLGAPYSDNSDLLNPNECEFDRNIFSYGSQSTISDEYNKDNKDKDSDKEDIIIIDRYSPKRTLKGSDALFSLDDTPS